MSLRFFCDGCDRDISDDPNTVHIRLQSNLRAMQQQGFPLCGKELEYCITCVKQSLPDVWSKLTT